jgi:hypothetical protein
MRYSWQRLDDGTWGVKASGGIDTTGNLAGQVVVVTNRSGREQVVALGERVDTWNAGRASVYRKADAKPAKTPSNGNGHTPPPLSETEVLAARVATLEQSVVTLRTIVVELLSKASRDPVSLLREHEAEIEEAMQS